MSVSEDNTTKKYTNSGGKNAGKAALGSIRITVPKTQPHLEATKQTLAGAWADYCARAANCINALQAKAVKKCLVLSYSERELQR